MPAPAADRAATFAAFAEHVSRGKVAFFERLGLDLVVGRRSGVFLFDAFSGRRFFDCHTNGGVFNLGHRHPLVLAALHQALNDDELDLGNHHLISPQRAELARRLAAGTGGRLPGVAFASGGGEAVDLAIKLARGVTARRGIVSARGGYHGHTGLALAAGDVQYRDAFGPNLDGFAQVPFGELGSLEAAVGDDTAAVLLEPIPATAGMHVPPPNYLPEVAALCRSRGALLIADEVQTGLGRTGRMWAHQHQDVTPDLLVTGKGLSGGLFPMAATLMSRDVHAFLDSRPFAHVSTFGGAELGCAVARAVLDVVESPGFLERVVTAGGRLRAALAGGPFKIHGRGLMLGLAFDAPDGGVQAARQVYEAGILCAFANNDTSVLQLMPPLIISDAELEELTQRLGDALG